MPPSYSAGIPVADGDVRAQRQLQARGELLYAQVSAGEDTLLQVKFYV